jgi:hypothetical protein
MDAWLGDEDYRRITEMLIGNAVYIPGEGALLPVDSLTCARETRRANVEENYRRGCP